MPKSLKSWMKSFKTWVSYLFSLIIDITSYVIKINHRKLLDAMIELAGAPQAKFKQICSSLDKLDKEPWSFVEQELIEEKGLTQTMTSVL